MSCMCEKEHRTVVNLKHAETSSAKESPAISADIHRNWAIKWNKKIIIIIFKKKTKN